MPIMLVLIGIVLIIILVAFAMFFGLIGAVSSGPEPSEGEKSAH